MEVSSRLKGATILNVGIPDRVHIDQVDGGGLIIDFIPKGETTASRIVMGFNERGIWVECNTSLEASQEG